jgi:hypothetical protein
MDRADVARMDKTEKALLDGSFNPEVMYRRIRNVVVIGTLVAVGVGLFGLWQGALAVLVASFLAYVTLVTIEKVMYARTILAFESLVRKLVRRVEALEGQPLTPDGIDHVILRDSRQPGVDSELLRLAQTGAERAP